MHKTCFRQKLDSEIRTLSVGCPFCPVCVLYLVVFYAEQTLQDAQWLETCGKRSSTVHTTGQNVQPADKVRVSLSVSGDKNVCARTEFSGRFDGHYRMMNVHPIDIRKQ